MFQIGHAGLTLSISLGACLNATLLYRAMRRRDVYRPLPGWGGFLARIAVALCVLGAVLWWMAGADAFWLSAGLWAKVGRLGLVIAAGTARLFRHARGWSASASPISIAAKAHDASQLLPPVLRYGHFGRVHSA